MKKILACLAAMVGAFGIVYASPTLLFTSPAGTNPINFPAVQGDLNAYVNAVNGAISPGVSGGAVGIFSGYNFQVGAQTSVGSLTLGLLVPAIQSPGTISSASQGLNSTTAKGFITFTDSQGLRSFIPFWQ